jgi:hypothetical protein
MEVCGVQEHLWLKQNPRRPRKIFKPSPPYVMKLKELHIFINMLASLKVPTYYCGAIGKHNVRELGFNEKP